MAHQSAIFLSGKIGNLVFVERNGKYHARTLPSVVKQTIPTKIRSKNFGKASSFCKYLRPLLRPMLPFSETKTLQGKFSGAFSKWFKLSDTGGLLPTERIPFVSDFNYNSHTSISERWKLPITITLKNTRELELIIPDFVPALALSAPAHTVAVECSIAVASCMMADTTRQTADLKLISFPFSGAPVKAQVLNFLVAAAPGTVIVTGMAINFRLANGQLNQRPSFMPVSIINARYC